MRSLIIPLLIVAQILQAQTESGWQKIYRFKGATKPLISGDLRITAAQLSIADSFANWMQASYQPHPYIGDIKKRVGVKIGLYNSHEKALPQYYGAAALTWETKTQNGFKKIIEETETEWKIIANLVPATNWAIKELCTPVDYYFTMPTADPAIVFGKKFNASTDDPAKLPSINKYPVFWIRNTSNAGLTPFVILAKDNQLPFTQVTKGEYLDLLEKAVDRVWLEEKKKIVESAQGNQRDIAFFTSQQDEKKALRKKAIMALRGKYKDRLQEKALTNDQPSLVELETQGNDPFVHYDGNNRENPNTTPVFRLKPGLKEASKKDKPLWITITWDYSIIDQDMLDRHRSIITGFNFDHVYRFFFDKGNPMTTQSEAQNLVEQYMSQEDMSPEDMGQEEKKEMRKVLGKAEDMSKKMEIAGIKPPVESVPLKIPTKQTQLLASIPTLTTNQQLNNYVGKLMTEARKKIPADLIQQTESAIAGFTQNPNDLSTVSIFLFATGNIKAALYAGLKALQQNPAHSLTQNNTAFILEQAGYPHKAIPIFKFLLTKYNTDNINNNLGQCFLSLGDKEEAKTYFLAALAKNPNHCEANCAMGLIATQEGNPELANKYIARSLENGYSPAAEELAKRNKTLFQYSQSKTKAPEYFNPQKFKPAPPAALPEEIPSVMQKRQAGVDLYRQAFKKAEAFQDSYMATLEKADPMTLMGAQYAGMGGAIANYRPGPFAKKAFFNYILLQKGVQEIVSPKNKVSAPYFQKATEYKQLLQKKFDQIQASTFENEARRCEAKMNALRDYLKLSSENYNNYVRHALPRIYTQTNDLLYWTQFLITGDAYLQQFYQETTLFYDRLNHFEQLQNLYPLPEHIFTACRNYQEELNKIKLDSIQADLNCPVNIKFGFKAVSYKVSCSGVEFELGIGPGKFGMEKNAVTGEFTLSFGLGVELMESGENSFDLSDALFNAGAKGTMYFKFDKDFSPVDMGMKGEAGMEANIFSVNMEEKITAVAGVGSLSVDAVHAGKELNVFSADATRDSRDVDAGIKPIRD